MRPRSLALLAFSLVALGFAAPSPLEAQSNEVRSAADCLHTADQRIQHLLGLLRDAESRVSRRDLPEDVRRDAQLSVEALEGRAREQLAEAARCVRGMESAEPGPSVRRDETTRDESTLGNDRGTVHEIERGTTLAQNVRVELGERVDGTGRAPDPNVQSAIRAIGGSLNACYQSFSTRSRGRRQVELQIALTVNETRTEEAIVESAPDADANLVDCVERAARSVSIAGQRGRSVYAYQFRLGE